MMRNNFSSSLQRHFGRRLFSPGAMLPALGIFLLLLLPSFLLAEELGKRVQRFTLKNGLRLLTLERHLSPTVAIYIRYRAGAADEADGKTETAHLLEHMMFKGTRTIGTRNCLREEKISHRGQQPLNDIDL
jgi:predicted Zn-dependent peptidase